MPRNEGVYAHEESNMTEQYNEAVLVYDTLPSVPLTRGLQGTLTVSDTTPAQGSIVAIDVDGFPGQTVALIHSQGTQPTVFAGVDFLIGGGLTLAGSSSTGNLHLDLTIPLGPAFEGMQFFLQGYVSDGLNDFTTAPKVLVIQ